MRPPNISRRAIIFAIVLIFLMFTNIFLQLLAVQLFPTYGGYTRQILFIKPDENDNIGGYFIIIDELAPESQNHNIDWLLHSRGNLDIAGDKQSFEYTVQSYISNDDISLNVSFLEKINDINNGSGVFCPVNYQEGENYDDVDTSYIKASYSGSQNPLMATVLYPKNDSDPTQNYPIITNMNSGLKKIGNFDYLYYNRDRTSVEFLSPDIEFNGKLFFLRQNDTDADLIDYYYLKDASLLKFSNKDYFSSSNALTNILATYSNNSQISGYIDGSNIQVSLYCPFNVQMVKLDRKNTTFHYSNSQVTFSITEPCSFVISSSGQHDNPENDSLRVSAPTRIKPTQNEYSFDESIFTGMQHPYILYNYTELENLRLKINDTSKPWNSWYNEYINGVEDICNTDLDSYEDDQRYHNVYKLALKFAIENNETCLNKTKDYLLDMGSITHYSQDLRMAYNVQAYAIAFDMIYNNLTSNEQNTIYNLLLAHASPLMRMDLYHKNNHRTVDAGALGVAGLVLKNTEMIDLATSTALDYYYDQNPDDGGSFEGYSYMAFAIIEMSIFAVGLRKLNSFDFYKDPKFIASLDYTGETLGPLGMPGSFEDCTFVPRIQETLLIAAAQINESDPLRAQNYQYVWEQRQNNTKYPGTAQFDYLRGENPSFVRILCYSLNESIIATPYAEKKEIWKESSMAFLRYGDEDGLFMPFSCKNYDQNHPHQDENSFELWAFGAYIANNPGYPGWGKKFHTWAQSTEGANSLLIGGSGQLQVIADGISSSITSPYFSMVIGEANEIYNDLGSINYTPEPYVLLASNFLMIFFIGLLFILIMKPESIDDTRDEKREKWSKKLGFKRNKRERSDISINNRVDLTKIIFFHPYRIQSYISRDSFTEKEAKFIKRIVFLVFSIIMVIIYISSSLNVKATIEYHSQYHEDKYNLIFELLPIVITLVFTVGTLLIILMTIGVIKMYGGSNRLLINNILVKERIDLPKSKVSSISASSILWLFPVLIFSGILIYSITVESLNSAIHLLWTELNSITDVYEFLVGILVELIRIFIVICIFGIPFLLLSINIFIIGVSGATENKINKKKAWKISLSSTLLILVVLSILFLTFFMIFKLLFSTISIESIVNE